MKTKIDEDFGLLFNSILPEIEKQSLREKGEVILVLDSKLEIKYVNSYLEHWRSLKSLGELKIDPDISMLLEMFSKNRINFLTLEVTIDWEEGITDYKVDITKLNISNQLYFLLVFESLTKKIRIERKINNLTYALDYGNIPVIIANANNEIIYSTTSFEKILNKSIEELFKANLVGILFPYLSLEERGLLESAVRELKPWKKTLIIQSKSGVKYYEFLVRPIFYENNSDWNLILTAHDLTDFVLKHEEIRRNEKLLNSIVNNISEMLVMFEKDGDDYNIKVSNKKFQEYLGVNNTLGYTLKDAFTGENYVLLQKKIKQLERNEVNYVNFERELDDGKFYEISGAMMLDPVEDKYYYIFTFNDLSNRIAYERQLKKAYQEEIKLNKLKNDFLENISHELRTPINAIVGYTDFIKESVEEKNYDGIEEISEALQEVVARLLKLFDNIISAANIEANKVEINPVTLNLNQVARDVHKKYSPVALEKELNFQMEFLDDPIYVNADWVKLEETLSALVDNAIKYTQEGRVFVKTFIEGEEGAVQVIDTGEGIDQSKLQHLIQPFGQGEEGYTRNYQGAGLGLTIAYKLALLMGGKIYFDKNVSKGTIVTLKFPLAEKP